MRKRQIHVQPSLTERGMVELWQILNEQVGGLLDADTALSSAIEAAIDSLGTMSTQNANDVAITGGSISGIDDPTDEHGVGDRGYNDARYLTAETDTWASVMARGNQSDTAGIIDVTNTEALLVRKDSDGGDVFIVDTTNSRVGIGTTPTSQFHLVGNNKDSYSVYAKGGTITGTGYGQYIYLEGGEGASDSTAGYSEGQIGGAQYLKSGTGGSSNAGSGDYNYSQGGDGGLFTFTGASGGSSYASGVGTYSAGGGGGSFYMSGGIGGESVGGGEVYSGRGGDFTLVSGRGGHGYATQDYAYIEGAYGGIFYMQTGAGGNAYNYYGSVANAKDYVTLIGGSSTGLFVSTGDGGSAISNTGDTTCSGNGGQGGELVFRTGNGGSGSRGGSINGGNGGYFYFSAGDGGKSTSSSGTGGNGGYLMFECGRKGTGSTDGSDGYIAFHDSYANIVLKILGDDSKNIQLPNDNGAILFGAGQDASIYYDGTNLVVNPKEVGSGYLQVDGQILATDKILFTQTDGNEYIDSLNDGYIDIGATTGIRLLQNTYLTSDNQHLYLGAGNDLDLYHDGTDSFIVTDATQPTDLIIDCGTEKTLELAEVVWDDLRTPVSQVRLSGSQPPTSTLYKGGEVLAFPSNADKTIYFNVQLPHKYKLGEDIEFHIHYVLPTTGSGLGAENVKWDFTYAWADIGDAIPAETPVPATLDMQNKSADTHYLGEIAGTIDGSGISGVSSMLICSLTRDTTVANNYTDDVYLMEVDFHFPLNTLGSRQEAVK